MPDFFGYLILISFVCSAGLYLTLRCLYLGMIQQTMNRCSTDSWAMRPALVWLELIPGFSVLWHFVVVGSLGLTLSREFRDRGRSRVLVHLGTGEGVVASIAGMVAFIEFAPALHGGNSLKGLGNALQFAIPAWLAYWAFVAWCLSRLSGAASGMTGLAGKPESTAKGGLR